jgi:uncharacterized protein YijF (DUF1287 family)
VKRLSLILLALLLILIAALYSLGYHGPRAFASGDSLPPVEKVVASARQLIGTPYDPLMGRHNNIGGKVGYIVCSDVPNIAYGLSGYSLKKMLEKDFEKHPAAYNTADGNKPGNPYFHRRARNLYAYFVVNGKLIGPAGEPALGDMVFYRSHPKGYIAHVALVTEAGPDGYHVVESAPETLWTKELPGKSPIERGWLLAGFGRMY